MTALPTEERPVAAWMGILGRIEEAVGRRLAQAEEPAPSTDAGPQAATPLQALDDRLAQMQARLERAEQDAGAADGALRTEAEAYQRWTEAMAAARRRLADWAALRDKTGSRSHAGEPGA